MVLTAYDLKAKQKDVPFTEVTIEKTKRGGYIAKGVNAAGNKMSSILSEDRKSTRLNSSHTDISRMPSSA